MMKINNSMNFDSWNNYRVKLNHDWLQNRYLIFLKAFKKTRSYDADNILQKLLTWRKKMASFSILITEAVEALSPKQLVEAPPLIMLSVEDRLWLGEVVHALYCERTRIEDEISSVQEKMQAADNMITKISKSLRKQSIVTDSDKDKLFSTLEEFSNSISALPHRIQVV